MRRAILLTSIILGLGGAPAFAATEAPYTQAAFTAAQSAGEPILVWVHASWCPTCAKQQPILSKLENEPAYSNLKVFMVDFDSQKDVVRSMGVQMQSTLIAFHGNKEAARSTGQTDEAAIRSVVSKTEG
jgi:thioredoxin-like negative regulator of GroEL